MFRVQRQEGGIKLPLVMWIPLSMNDFEAATPCQQAPQTSVETAARPVSVSIAYCSAFKATLHPEPEPEPQIGEDARASVRACKIHKQGNAELIMAGYEKPLWWSQTRNQQLHRAGEEQRPLRQVAATVAATGTFSRAPRRDKVKHPWRGRLRGQPGQ